MSRRPAQHAARVNPTELTCRAARCGYGDLAGAAEVFLTRELTPMCPHCSFRERAVVTPDARPLVVGWGHSAARNSAGWRLRVAWPLAWLRDYAVVDFVEIDETGAYVTGAGPREWF